MTDFVDDDRDLPRKGPDAFRTISEVAEELGLPQHVLRFWETKFPQIRPIKRGGGRRYYRPADVDLLKGVKQLLYGEGYTIRGVQRILREQGGRRHAQEAGARAAPTTGPAEPMDERTEPGLSSQPAARPHMADGPDLWASGRRPAAPERLAPEPPFDDPEEADDAYDVGAPMTAESAAPRPVERPQGLSRAQVGRLSAALDELKTCRRLLSGRS